jgi:hypothetical protein
VVSDQDRRDLYEALERGLGEGPAATMMELLPPVGWGDLVRPGDLAEVRGELAGVRGEIGQVRGEIAKVRGEMAELRAELKSEIGELRTELKNDIGELRAELQAQLPRLYVGNMAMAFATAGLVLAAARLA